MPTEILIKIFMLSMKYYLYKSISACNKDTGTCAFLVIHISKSHPPSFITGPKFRVEMKAAVLLCEFYIYFFT